MRVWEQLTCSFDAVHSLVDIWNTQGKVSKAAANVIGVLAIVVGQFQGKVLLLRARCQEGVCVLLLFIVSQSSAQCMTKNMVLIFALVCLAVQGYEGAMMYLCAAKCCNGSMQCKATHVCC